MCLAQGHNGVNPVRLEPMAPLSRVKHSTTEPLRSPGVISESSYKETILQRKYRKMTILWSFSYDSYGKLHSKKN